METCPTRDLYRIQCRASLRDPTDASAASIPPCLAEAERVEREASAISWRAVKTVAQGSRLEPHIPRAIQPFPLRSREEISARLGDNRAHS